jgi:RNA polymerase sigma-70 factor, ECF subfamily
VFRGVHLDVALDQHATTPRPAASDEPSDRLRGETRVSSTRPPTELRTEISGASPTALPSGARLDVESLYLEHFDRLFGAMRRFCAGDHALAEEITQETFLQAYRLQHSLASVANPYAWLLVVARNTARDYFRRQGRQREKDHRHYLLVSREGAEEKEEWLLEDLLDQLPERERRALEYRFVFDYDLRTIARKMGVSRRSVNNYIARALRRIRRGFNLPEEG